MRSLVVYRIKSIVVDNTDESGRFISRRGGIDTQRRECCNRFLVACVFCQPGRCQTPIIHGVHVRSTLNECLHHFSAAVVSGHHQRR
jgi:hypothetical protein